MDIPLSVLHSISPNLSIPSYDILCLLFLYYRGIVSEKTDAELFTIETSGADDVSTTCVRTQGSRKRIWKPLKCESNLLNESKIEPVITKKPKLWKNKIKDKAKLLSKKATMSYTINNGSTSSNPTTTSLPSYDLWGTGK